MKRIRISIICTIVISILLQASVYANTIITAPIDSRPISTEYLKNLTQLAGDDFYTVDPILLDFFSDDSKNNSFADSSKVREAILKLVAEHNTADTTVIINTSTYFTGGLVGSRCAKSYSDYEEAMKDLNSLVTAYDQPVYYVALTMPRNLPETRNNQIWPNDDLVRGLGHYYLQYEKDSALKDIIRDKYTRVTPVQFLMEWSYVENKAAELGVQRLTEWERDFLYFTEDMKAYDSYLEEYRIPFQRTAEICATLIRWQKKGLINEVVISNDDLQLPAFISFLYQKDAGGFIPLENGSPIKYSFARTYITSGKESILKKIELNYGKEEAEKALTGRSGNINFIFGMDEIPQLIYARDVSKRQSLSADIQPQFFGIGRTVADYDVLNSEKLVSYAINFVKGSEIQTKTPLSLVIYDYTNEDQAEKALLEMKNGFQEGKEIGLIELYGPSVWGSGNHAVFQSLWNQGENGADKLTLPQLACYSAWNTNANAVGLGVAHGQIYSIMKERTSNEAAFLEAHLEILGQHILEDGYYNASGKQKLASEKYLIQQKDQWNSKILYQILPVDAMEQQFLNTSIDINGKQYKTVNYSVKRLNLPWKRLFDCYVKINAEVEVVQ